MCVYIIIGILVISFITFSEELNIDRINLYRVYIKKEKNILNVSEVSNITYDIFT